ncbi:hypothetical protein [Acinetobacter rathckeae]|uniref:hypothetical protein n=1 Tax=Acinetobacter rathckeae TaxID=2605272 RepID=UPI0018A33920|nr:hypothetical protein [Acinetobacter rathckeae]MBF7687044.1 hypothetical protein [Acinetobacter rathckeae]
MNTLAKTFPTTESYWDFMAKFGKYPGKQNEATHYKTLGNSTVFLKVENGQTYFWVESESCWVKNSHYKDDNMTPIGQKEPVIYGPPKPERIFVVPAPAKPYEIYSDRRYKGD